MLKGITRLFVLVGVLSIIGLAIACANGDAPRFQSTPVTTGGESSSNRSSESTPTSTSATASDSIPLQPVIRLHYGGQVYDGVQGNFCWPTEPGVSRCAVEGPFPWQDMDVPAIPVTAGDSINVVIEADERPQKLRVAIFGEASKHASDAAMRVVELDPGLEAPLAVDLPASVYNLRITGQWEVGDQSYKFRLKVE